MIDFKVSELINYIKDITISDYVLMSLNVEGEISNLTLHSSGNAYFSLKDELSTLSCIFYNYKDNENIKSCENGDLVSVTGKIQVVEKDGTLRLNSENVEKIGLGQLFKNYLLTKDELEKTGYFDELYKKPLPKFPKKIGVITSSDGAAIKDILSVVERRNPFVNIYLYPSVVQGPYSVDSLIRGLDFFKDSDMDLVIIGRGGGSYEDLDSFNSKDLAIKIFEFPLPIISAVGHEIDFVISDFVADLRAATPTAAAELAVFDYYKHFQGIKKNLKLQNEILEKNTENEISKLKSLKRRISLLSLEVQIDNKKEKLNSQINILNNALNHKLDMYSVALNKVYSRLNFERLNSKVTNLEINLYEKINRSNSIIKDKYSAEEKKLLNLKSRLEKLDITSMLGQGYSIVLDEKNNVIKSLNDIEIDEHLNILINDGQLEVKVIKKRLY